MNDFYFILFVSQRIKDLQESLEFAEAERSTLSEYITELEQQVKVTLITTLHTYRAPLTS